ncbi:N-acetylglucosaminyl-phosphatidylinositol biosynthetic protein gpi1 [Quillaja saponaria]|uniref:N-acetylglucosaminyl-phosphatidylinositol biosynthetic protein gpi1 n=1 Tax=Quillaja saponaria TaxID=32244 RepID=A0AAD7Q8G6_QUISA|nr:N-acetylglucosaminyl-phosphatidylinositol biosynthetic protein gpi1 [Quillaja saponaria]
MFSLLGQCSTDMSSNSLMDGIEDTKKKLSTSGNACEQRMTYMYPKNLGQRICGCLKLDGSLAQCRQASIGNSNWVQLIYDSHVQTGGKNIGFPKLHHIHWSGKTLSQCDVDVIIYETPSYGAHHFSMSSLNSYEEVRSSFKKPKWVDELHKKQAIIDLDIIILSINCAAAAKTLFERRVVPKSSSVRFSIVFMSIAFTRHMLATFIASLFTLFFIFLQLLHMLFEYGAESWICITSAKVFRNAWVNIQIRCCQILYWPIFLQKNDARSQSCVEYMEKAALYRHSMWATLVVDVLMGNLIGLALLYHAESVCLLVLNFVHDIANMFLRSGCVWLMGVPAGFKLNTELAGVLGMISLNAIQVWSTLWIFGGSIFHYIMKGLAVLGILCGFTIPAALVIDMIAIATLHVSTLHWLISVLYSSQIQALASLWRLFRGQKWNPLRQRLDSFDYTVKQHVVGSLLFTPLLLLLPTTSVFYIFFSIVNTTINLICILIEVTISVIHATPYIKIFLWLVRPRRFPSGIWFEIVCCRSNDNGYAEFDCADEIISPSTTLPQRKDASRETFHSLVSVLHSNYLSIGQVILPHYKYVFSRVPKSFVSTSAYGILTGRRMPSRLGTVLPSPMPWLSMPYKEYWSLCYDSLAGCCSH